MPCRIAPWAAVLVLLASAVAAQETAPATDAPPETATAETVADDPSDNPDLLTDAELQTLVAPVALYPDTLLVQILVGTTAPLDVMKASRFLLANVDAEKEALKTEIEAQGYDPSVEVLAVAFPDIVDEMANHIDWTETVGTAMLAQSDDVMSAVQVLRDQAIQTGALVDTPEQVVSTDPVTNAIVVQPANPEVVYVPQYAPSQVWGVGDVVTAGVITWGAVAIIDEIFDDDDDWGHYWGCRNCGGWGGGPIIRNPDVDIDIDGNVNIGNRLDIGGDNLGDRRPGQQERLPNLPGREGNGWKPDPDRAEQARAKIGDRRGSDGATTLPLRKPTERDNLRQQLSTRTGTVDLAGQGGNASQIRDRVASPGGGGAEALKRKSSSAAPLKRPNANTRSAVAHRAPGAAGGKIRSPGSKRATKAPIARQHSGARTRAASARGGKSRGGGRSRRR